MIYVCIDLFIYRFTPHHHLLFCQYAFTDLTHRSESGHWHSPPPPCPMAHCLFTCIPPADWHLARGSAQSLPSDMLLVKIFCQAQAPVRTHQFALRACLNFWKQKKWSPMPGSKASWDMCCNAPSVFEGLSIVIKLRVFVLC